MDHALSDLLATDQRQRFAAAAARDRLAVLATCCRPSRLIAALRNLRDHLAARRCHTACCA